MSIDFQVTCSLVRVRTSGGEASFLMPSAKGKPVLLGNDIPCKWLTLDAGTKFLLCAKFEKTDTFMVAIDAPKKAPQGIILRRMSFDKLIASTKEQAAPVAESTEPDVEAEAVQVAAEQVAAAG